MKYYPNYFSVDRISGSSETSRTYENENYSFSQSQKIDFEHYSVKIGDALSSGNLRNNRISHQACNPFGGFYGNQDLHNYGGRQIHRPEQRRHGYFGYRGGGFSHQVDQKYDCGCDGKVTKPKVTKPDCGCDTKVTKPKVTKPDCGCDTKVTKPKVTKQDCGCDTKVTKPKVTKQDCGCPSGTTGTQWGQTKKADIYSPINLKAWFSDGRKAEVAPSVFGEYSFDD